MAFQYSIEFRSTGIIDRVLRSKRVPATVKEIFSNFKITDYKMTDYHNNHFSLIQNIDIIVNVLNS